MKLSLNNFLYGIRQIVTGGGIDATGNPVNDAGFLVENPVPLSALDLNTTRVVDTSDTGSATDAVVESGAYFADDETNARVIKVDAATDEVFRLTVPIPRDYDPESDVLTVRVLASQLTQSTDDDVELDSEAYVKTAGSALDADLDIAAPGTVLSTTEQWIEFNFYGDALDRDDVLTFKLITNGANDTGGEEVLIHAVSTLHRSTLVSYEEYDSSGNLLR